MVGDTGVAGDPAAALEDLRREMDGLDRDLLELIRRRTSVARRIAREKARLGMPTRDRAREAEVVDRAAETAARAGLPASGIRPVFQHLLSLSRAVQSEEREMHRTPGAPANAAGAR